MTMYGLAMEETAIHRFPYSTMNANPRIRVKRDACARRLVMYTPRYPDAPNQSHSMKKSTRLGRTMKATTPTRISKPRNFTREA
jgi:hypothetical protein